MKIQPTIISETENATVLGLGNHEEAVSRHLAEVAEGKTPTMTTEELLDELDWLHDDVSDYDDSNKWLHRFYDFGTADVENLMDELYELAE